MVAGPQLLKEKYQMEGLRFETYLEPVSVGQYFKEEDTSTIKDRGRKVGDGKRRYQTRKHRKIKRLCTTASNVYALKTGFRQFLQRPYSQNPKKSEGTVEKSKKIFLNAGAAQCRVAALSPPLLSKQIS